MKKRQKLLSMLSLGLLGVSVLFTSCEKDNNFELSESTELTEGFSIDADIPDVSIGYPDIPYEEVEINGKKIVVQRLPGRGFIINRDQFVTKEGLERMVANEKANVGENGMPRIWTNGVVYYQYDNLYGPPSQTVKDKVASAMRYIESVTSLRFVFGKGNGFYISIEQGGNAAEVGMRGAGQFFSISSSASFATTVHELGHTIGLAHEHQRADRDNYIAVNPNVLRGRLRDQYKKEGVTFGSFDWDSIMLYPSRRQSNGEWDVIRASDRKPFRSRLSNSNSGFSQGDLAVIRALYNR
ncbi:hypothetical protein HN014_08615 [Aquimarina sp. TRL1]|uniref:M12 family metallopeptidase n=1 Tax=Aquimarina sp. (strain TRL1) TaxID=2736252 RepID=UPI00158BE904|nr:M12 family metallopeptidase [Aquimarina sp. TRL1]QKX04976.1 hypothetical protein HN014_08615 [Aquimarina sp. TRL1]